MWRIGTVALLLAAFSEDTSALGNGEHGPLLERLKRHEPDYCPEYSYPHHHHHPPPYWRPPPRHWPPPPPPYWSQPPQWRYEQQNKPSQGIAESQASGGASAAKSEALSQGQQFQGPQIPNPQLQGQGAVAGKPCESCGQNSAVSNAESQSGTAIAVAIARAKTDPK